MGRRRKRSRSKKRSKKRSLKIRRRPSPKKRRVRKKAKRRAPKRIRSKRRSKKRRSPNRIKKDRKPRNKKEKGDRDKDEDFDDMDDLDDYIEDDFLDSDVIDPDNISGKKWAPDKVEDHVAKQWGERFKKKDGTKPKRLKVNAPNTPERIKKYTDKEGQFDTDKYVSDVRSKMADRGSRRGFIGDATAALRRKGPQKIEPTKPKYGAAIDALKGKLGGIKYDKLITETTDKLTRSIKPNGRKFKKTGLSIIKNRSSEDGALPNALETRESRRPDRKTRRGDRRARRKARRESRRAARKQNT